MKRIYYNCGLPDCTECQELEDIDEGDSPMSEYNDDNIPMKCGECDLLEEGIPAMEQHVFDTHPQYTPEEAKEYVRAWADASYDEIDAYNMWRAEEYRRTGHDPEEVDEDRSDE
jgi:hypothetical protein